MKKIIAIAMTSIISAAAFAQAPAVAPVKTEVPVAVKAEAVKLDAAPVKATAPVATPVAAKVEAAKPVVKGEVAPAVKVEAVKPAVAPVAK